MSGLTPATGGPPALRDEFDRLLKLFASTTEADRTEAVVEAVAVWIGYPLHAEAIECRDEWTRDEKDSLRAHLASVHYRATERLMQEAERAGLNPAPLRGSHQVCLELFGPICGHGRATPVSPFGVVWFHHPQRTSDFWPACLGPWRYILPPAMQEAIYAGEDVFNRLMVKWDTASPAADRPTGCLVVGATPAPESLTPPPIEAGRQPAPADQPAKGGLTWQEAAERMERLRLQGEPWPGSHTMKKQLGCSSATINKAVRKTETLRAWADTMAGNPAAPRAQSMTVAVTGRTPQRRELDPADDLAIREYLERDDLSQDERAFFNSMSTEDQLDFLKDPDEHQKILGRKP